MQVASPASERELLLDIHALERELIEFEIRYGIRSDVFYPAYCAGDEPANDEWVLDFSEWAGIYRAWMERQAEYRNALDRFKGRTLSALVKAA